MSEGTFMLHHKTAVIYGAAGIIGDAVARAFARHGASVFTAWFKDTEGNILAVSQCL